MSLSYRPDIDGLRAVTIILIVSYHINANVIPGAFVSVDIFFVISGYLIAAIIQNDIFAGRFSLLHYAERRVRRIIPAFIALLFFVTIFGFFFLTPSRLSSIGNEIKWSSFFLLNHLYYKGNSYFEAVSSTKSLVHFWTLCLEVQFYIFSAIIAVIILKLKLKPAKIISALLVISFFISCYTSLNDPLFSFYLFPSRLWEFLFGSLLALKRPSVTKTMMSRDVLAAAGVVIITIPILTYSNDIAFPGLAALPPVLGASLLIWSGASTGSLVSRGLSYPPIVFIGRISYSLYLWHWPMIFAVKYYFLRDIEIYEVFGFSALCLFIAYISYRFIEAPFLKGSALPKTRQILVAASILLLTAAGSGWWINNNHGIPSRLDETALTITSFSLDNIPINTLCTSASGERDDRYRTCTIGTPRPGPPDFAVWGDSHSLFAKPVLQALAERHGIWGVMLSSGGCPPVAGIKVLYKDKGDIHCDKYIDAALKTVFEKSVKNIIIIAYWQRHAEDGGRNGFILKTLSQSADSPLPRFGDEQANKDTLHHALKGTFSLLKEKGMNVFVLEPIPASLFHVPEAMTMLSMMHRPLDEFKTPRTIIDQKQSWISSVLKEEEERENIQLIRTKDFFCDSSSCRVHDNGIPLYVDSNHLSAPGSFLLRPALDPVFQYMKDAHRP